MSGVPQPRTWRRIFRPLLVIFRWLFILACFGFVVSGWIRSATKYMNGKTSVSILVNETNTFLMPSITLCSKFRNEWGLLHALLEHSWGQPGGPHNSTLDDKVFNESLARLEVPKWEFLSLFLLPKEGGPSRSKDLTHRREVWVETIPHPELSGKCFTYNPDFKSVPGEWHGYRIGLRFPGAVDLPSKLRHLAQVSIFIHDQDDFYFFKEDHMPSSSLIDSSQLRYKGETTIRIKFSRSTTLNTEARPCTNDIDYSFMKCVENAFAAQRGCQAPWQFFPENNLPKCRNMSEMERMFHVNLNEPEWSRPFWSKIEKSLKSGCPQPCTVSNYGFGYSYKDQMDPMHGDADWALNLWFPNFLFKYEEEYAVCDLTCFIGELGGNLGFFLGGSLLTLFDLILNKGVDFEKHP